jgi:hypothetical protein
MVSPELPGWAGSPQATPEASRASETPSGPGAVCMPLALYMDDHVPIAITEGTRPICS